MNIERTIKEKIHIIHIQIVEGKLIGRKETMSSLMIEGVIEKVIMTEIEAKGKSRGMIVIKQADKQTETGKLSIHLTTSISETKISRKRKTCMENMILPDMTMSTKVDCCIYLVNRSQNRTQTPIIRGSLMHTAATLLEAIMGTGLLRATTRTIESVNTRGLAL